MVSELIWDGKYDAAGKRTAPVRVALPFQTVETVNESAQQRQLTLDLFSQGRDSAWRNRLIWGDKKYVLPSLLSEFAGKVDLIYIDPPFDTGADFSFTTQIPDSDATLTKEPSMIEQKAYRDTWGKGLDGYLQWFYETAMLLHELLAETGSIYVHLDWHVGHYAKAVLDEVFGSANFLNEIIWKRTPFAGSSKARAKKYPINHDTILFYSRHPDRYSFQHSYDEYSEEYKGRFKYVDHHGSYRKTLLKTYSKSTEVRLRAEDRWIDPISKGAYPSYKQYLHESKGKQIEDIWSWEDAAPGSDSGNVWEDINAPNPMSEERVGYPTQKPEALLDRIIRASSNEGDLILDCFCGSGTTTVVAEKLKRRWITCDLGRFAIQTARKRLLALPDVRPFAVQNLGKYERQAWQAAEFRNADRDAAIQSGYRRFILDLYRADPLEGFTYLHGLKNGRFIYVGSVDAPVTAEDVKAIARECWKAGGRGVGEATNAADVLGWDFAFEVNETAKAIAADANVKLAFKRIPREVLEKKAVDQGEIVFFELAALSLNVVTKGLAVTLALHDFMVPPDDVPLDVQRAISHWSQWIDYWAVDWDFRDDTFHNLWQCYRTRKEPKLQQQVAHAYDQPGRYCIVVKVIDILGNDTTKSITVEVE